MRLLFTGIGPDRRPVEARVWIAGEACPNEGEGGPGGAALEFSVSHTMFGVSLALSYPSRSPCQYLDRGKTGTLDDLI